MLMIDCKWFTVRENDLRVTRVSSGNSRSTRLKSKSGRIFDQRVQMIAGFIKTYPTETLLTPVDF
jgi:hypothetical protein